MDEHTEHDETANAILRAEMQDEFGEAEELDPTPEELSEEQEEALTIPEQRWLEDLEHRLKEWKESTSKQPFDARSAIRKLRIEQLTPEDIALFHAYRQLEKTPSPYFTTKFGRLLRARRDETKNETEGSSYQFTKVLDALTEASES